MPVSCIENLDPRHFCSCTYQNKKNLVVSFGGKLSIWVSSYVV